MGVFAKIVASDGCHVLLYIPTEYVTEAEKFACPLVFPLSAREVLSPGAVNPSPGTIPTLRSRGCALS